MYSISRRIKRSDLGSLEKAMCGTDGNEQKIKNMMMNHGISVKPSREVILRTGVKENDLSDSDSEVRDL